MIGKILRWGSNERPFVRFVRGCVMAGIVGALTFAVQEFPSVDFPGEMDATIVLFGTPVLLGLDKWLRSRS